MLASLIALAAGYFAGSIPSGVIVTRLAGAADPRGIGSGNIGATNVLRTGRKGLAAATLLLDLLKGAGAVLLVAHLWPGEGPLAGVGAFVGHCYPVWLRFRGGKGVACALGAVLAVEPWVGLGAVVVFGLAKTVVPFVGEASVVTLIGIGLVGLLGLVGGGDDQYVLDPGQHQRGEWVVDHRLVVDGHQLLAHREGDGVQPRARAAGQDDSAHGRSP